MFCSVLASAVRALAFVLIQIMFLSLGLPLPAWDRDFPSCSLSTCTHAGPFTEAGSLQRKAQAYELEGVKRVRNLKYLTEQQPYCAPSSSDSPSCADHKLVSPEDVTGICLPFPHLLIARHRDLWLAQQPDLLTLAQQLGCTPRSPGLPEGGVLCTQGCVHSFKE